MVVVSPNGKCWFGVDSKTFKISINEAKGKVFKCERAPTFLLFHVGERFKNLGRREKKVSIELRTKKRDNFVLHTDWMWKLRSLGFSLSQRGEDSSASSSRGRGLKRVSVRKKDPIGDGGGLLDQPTNLDSLKSWAHSSWMLKGNIRLALLRGPFILFEFEDVFEDVIEAERVLHSGVKWFKGKCLILDCLEVWVRILGLPLHIWGMSFFKNLGEACGRFVGVDKDTVECQNL
ncbi:hypothetical protein AAG906_040322 [Vitis piasezkii]